MIEDLALVLGGNIQAQAFLRERFGAALKENSRIHRGETAVKWLRRILASSVRDLEPGSTKPPAISDALAAGWVRTLLPALRPRYANLIRRLDLDGERKPVVARELGQTLNSTDVALHRARQGLRHRFTLVCDA